MAEHSPIGTFIGTLQAFDPDTPSSRIDLNVTSDGDVISFEMHSNNDIERGVGIQEKDVLPTFYSSRYK